MKSDGNGMRIEVGRILKILGAKEVEIDLCREQISELSQSLQKAEARIKKLEAEKKESEPSAPAAPEGIELADE